MPTIDILLATYNGAQFLREQLGSLEAQSFADWQLVVRDDGSTDGTLAIIAEWATHAAVPVRMVDDGRKGLGASGNFGALLEASDAPYFAFCDQDDVWLPEKLALMLERVQVAETRLGADRPVLAYSDLRVVDAELNDIHSSFRAYASLVAPRPGREVADLMTQNVVTGCASLGNAALRKAALPFPSEAIMHDWWLALTAAEIGELVDVPEPTILYRQHDRNAIGAVRWTFATVLGRVATDLGNTVCSVKAFIADTQRQARAFQARFGEDAPVAACSVIAEYGELAGRPLLARKKFALEHAFKPRRPLRNWGLIAFM